MASLWIQRLRAQYGTLLQQMVDVERQLQQLQPDQTDELGRLVSQAQDFQREADAVHEQVDTLAESILKMIDEDCAK